MSTAEALRELRLLAVQLRSARPADVVLLGQVLATFREVAEDGADPVTVLQIRRFRRLAAAGAAGASNGAAPLTDSCPPSGDARYSSAS